MGTRATQWTQSGSASTTFSTVAASAAAAARSLHAHHANLLHSAAAAAAAVYQIPSTEHMPTGLASTVFWCTSLRRGGGNQRDGLGFCLVSGGTNSVGRRCCRVHAVGGVDRTNHKKGY